MFVFTKLSKKAWLVLYVLLSGLDLILTHRLLTHNGEMVYEGNPLARFGINDLPLNLNALRCAKNADRKLT